MESRGTFLETYLNICTMTDARFIKRLAKDVLRFFFKRICLLIRDVDHNETSSKEQSGFESSQNQLILLYVNKNIRIL